MKNQFKHGNEFANDQDEKLADRVVNRLLWFGVGIFVGVVLANLNF